MKKVICALTVAVLCACGPLWAQGWTIDLHETTQHLDSICAGSGHPLADGTEIRIYHDWNSNGPDDADTLLGVCNDPPLCEAGPNGTVNYNTFPLNGLQFPVPFAGGFSTLESPVYETLGSVFCNGSNPIPNRIYLRVCAGNRHYDSEIRSPTGGGAYSEIEIGSWTCVEAPCPGCERPPRITQISATPGCRAIDLQWTYPQVPYPADSLFIWRQVNEGSGAQIGYVPPAVTTFHDTITDERGYMNSYTYRLRAQHTCSTGTVYVYSSEVTATPDYRAFFGQLLHVDATDTVCDSVMVTWRYLQFMGYDDPDSFVIVSSNPSRRWGAVAWRNFQTHYGLWCYPPHHGIIYYYIDYWSRGCGQYPAGTAADDGRALDCTQAVDGAVNLLPAAFCLYPNYPNPFNSRTRITFDLPRAASVTMTVFNLSGQRVATLVNAITAAGSHAVDFDAAAMSSGVYVVRLEADGWTSSRKMLLLR